MDKPLKISLVGRPNVGKSTLFNRLAGKRLAIVADEPGVTRDWKSAEADLFGLALTVTDTAGLEEKPDETLEGRMRLQTEKVVESSDIILLIVDGREGITPSDEFFARWVRKKGIPAILVCNKCENPRERSTMLAEAYRMGFGEPVAMSAEHGIGFDELHERIGEVMEKDDIAGHLQDVQAETREKEFLYEEDSKDALEKAATDLLEEQEARELQKPLQLAVVGRPNVGKSTLINNLIGEERLLTGPEAGITRDAIAINWTYQGRDIRLLDTAGLRKRGKIKESLEKLSAADTKRAIDFAHVVLVLLDATLGVESQDLTIIRQVVTEGRALVVGVNKWDICEDREERLADMRERLQDLFPEIRGVPIVTMSALDGKGMDKLFKAVFKVYDIWNKRMPTATLNRWLTHMTAMHPPPAPGGRRIRIKYMTQARIRPPTFAIACSNPKDLPRSYLRYLENGLRKDFDMEGVPIRLHLKKGANPYEGRKRKKR